MLASTWQSLLNWLAGLFDPIAGIPGPAPGPGSQPPPTDPSPALLATLNATRTARGLAPLVSNPLLTAAAQAHAVRMAVVGTLAHIGIGDGGPWSRIAATGYRYESLAEVIAEGQATAADAVGAWLIEPAHRADILGPYRECGVGFARDAAGRPYWCVDLGSPAVFDQFF